MAVLFTTLIAFVDYITYALFHRLTSWNPNIHILLWQSSASQLTLWKSADISQTILGSSQLILPSLILLVICRFRCGQLLHLLSRGSFQCNRFFFSWTKCFSFRNPHLAQIFLHKFLTEWIISLHENGCVTISSQMIFVVILFGFLQRVLVLEQQSELLALRNYCV